MATIIPRIRIPVSARGSVFDFEITSGLFGRQLVVDFQSAPHALNDELKTGTRIQALIRTAHFALCKKRGENMAYVTVSWDQANDIWFSGLELLEHKVLLSNTETPVSEIFLRPHAADTPVSLHSSDTDVVDIIDGKIIAKSPGTAIITATAEDCITSYSCKIEVKSPLAKYAIVTWDQKEDTWLHEHFGNAYLIKDNNTHYTYKNNTWYDINKSSVTHTDFENHAFNSLADLTTPLSVIVKTMNEKGTAGKGKIFIASIAKKFKGISKIKIRNKSNNSSR